MGKKVTIKSKLHSFGLGVHIGPSGCKADRVPNMSEYSGNAGVGSWIEYPGPSCAKGL